MTQNLSLIRENGSASCRTTDDVDIEIIRGVTEILDVRDGGVVVMSMASSDADAWK